LRQWLPAGDERQDVNPGVNAMAFILKDVPPDQFPTIRIIGGFVAGLPRRNSPETR